MMNIDPGQLRAILCQHPDIRQAILFGSVARGEAGADSDLDLAVEAKRSLSVAAQMRLAEDLAVASGRPIDLVDLKTVGEPLLGQIIQHGQRILGDDADYAALLYRHLLDAADVLPYAERILRERRRAWIG